MEEPPDTGTPLPAAAENWESEGGRTIAEPPTVPTLRLVSGKGKTRNSRQAATRDDERVQLRAIVATIDREIARLPRPAPNAGGDTSTDTLIVSWDALVKLLALGPDPEIPEGAANG